jgi:hypothetical protein
MTTTIYPGIAASILPVLPSFSFYGTSWTVVRASGGTISAPPTLTNMGDVTAYVVRNKVDAALMALPQTTIYTAPWLVFGAADIDIRVGDVLISVAVPNVAFLAVGEPATDFGMLFGPLAPCMVPAAFDDALLDDEGQPLRDDV